MPKTDKSRFLKLMKLIPRYLVKSEQSHPLETVKKRSLEAKNDPNRAEKTEYIRSTVVKTS